MTRRVMGWVASGVLAAVLLAVGAAWTLHMARRSNDLALQLEAERQRNFSEMITHVNAIQGLLGKGVAAGSASQNMLYMGEVYRRSSLATANFSALPVPGPLAASTGKFLQQVGDFAYSIARGEAAGRLMDGKQRTELARLQQESSSLSAELQAMGQHASRNGFRWVAPNPSLADVLRGRAVYLYGRPRAASQDQPVKAMLPTGLAGIGPRMDRLPTLVYDGPFSDHRSKIQPQMTGPQVEEAEARRIALGFVPGGANYGVIQSQLRKGTPWVWSFTMTPGGNATGNPRVMVDVSYNGGHLVKWLSSRAAGPARIDLARAKEIGRTYLAERGFPDMVPTYGIMANGFATVQYAYRHRGALVYPDQIKVRIALDNGEVAGIDAQQYVMAHKQRGELEVPAVSRQEAARALNPDLKVQRVQLAIIPNEAGDNEALTYEFVGTIANQTYLVYVNAKTGTEERILQLQILENGTLAL